MVPSIIQEEQPWCLCPSWDFYCILVSRSFLVRFEILFLKNSFIFPCFMCPPSIFPSICNCCYYLLPESFSHQFGRMVLYWSLSDCKSPQISRTLLSILAVLNNAIVWKVSTRPPNSKSSGPFNNPLVTVPKAPITIGIIVTFLFQSFFNSLARTRFLSFFPLSLFYSMVNRDSKDKFTYRGSSVSSTEKDIDTRLTKAWTAIDRLSIIWKSDLTNKMSYR